ncbi:MAG TPA: aminopeptidase N [Marmoricola sp.]
MSLKLTEARARAATLAVQSYDVHLDLTDLDRFTSTVVVRFASTGKETFAEFVGADSFSGGLNGLELPATAYAEGRVHLGELQPENELRVTVTAPYTTTGEGMHTFTDPVDGERYVSAYTGMDMASRVFCCFDQLDLKAPITLTVVADPAWTVLANGIGHHDGAGTWSFATTPPICPSLFVVCAGPWASHTWDHAGIPFGWHARASLAGQLDRDIDELRTITERCFDHYTSTFTPPYAFDSYDQILVPGLNWGAMEEPGCVTFREELLPDATPTPQQQMLRATVIAHEMAHMWFGDLATMRWWQDSWLNESFADYMGYQVAALAGHDGAWVEFALGRKPSAYVADARHSTHPIAEDAEALVDVETALGNFDMITYAKGAAVLRQLVAWLGDDDFVAGVNVYLERYAFGNADLADFLDCLASVTDRDVRGWAAAWLRTTGADTIEVHHGAPPRLHRSGSRPHRFTIGGFDDDGRLARTAPVDLAGEDLALESFAGLTVLADIHEEAYALHAMDAPGWEFVETHLGRIEDPLTRSMLWSAAMERARTAALPVPALLRLAQRHLVTEGHALIVEHMLITLTRTVATWSSTADLAANEHALHEIATRLLDGPAPVTAALVAIATSDDPRALAEWLDHGAVKRVILTSDTRWRAVQRIAALGAGLDACAAESALDRREAARLSALTTRASEPSSEAKAAAWERMHDPATSNREYRALAEGLWQPGQHELVDPYLHRYPAASIEPARRRGPGFAQVIGYGFPTLPLPDAAAVALRDQVRSTLRSGEVPTVLARQWHDRLDDLEIARNVRSARPSDATD